MVLRVVEKLHVAAVLDGDGVLVELQLRNWIDEIGLPSVGDELIDAMAQGVRARVLAQFLAEARNPDAVESGASDWLSELASASSDEASSSVGEAPDDVAVPLTELVVALILADHLAADGYRDPRLEVSTTPWSR